MEALHTIPIRAPLAYLLSALIAGLILANTMPAHPILPATTGLLIAMSLLWQIRKITWTPCFLAAATLLCWSYGELRLPARPDAELLSRPPREATLS